MNTFEYGVYWIYNQISSVPTLLFSTSGNASTAKLAITEEEIQKIMPTKKTQQH